MIVLSSVATHYKLWAGNASEYQSNASFIQLGDDCTGLWMGCLTLEVKV